MEKITPEHLLQLLIEYFETGNKETDAVAKAIVSSDVEFTDIWQEEMRRYRQGTDWTGIRAVEAEVLTFILQKMKTRLERRTTMPS